MALLAYQQFPLEQVSKWGTVGKANNTKAELNIPIIFHKVDSTWKKRPFGDYIENCHITMRGVASWSLGGNLILSVSFVSNIYMSERGPGVGYNTNRYTPAWRRDTASTSFILFIWFLHSKQDIFRQNNYLIWLVCLLFKISRRKYIFASR